jgi:formylglycine-generating enzyme required for sulfatase activity
MSINDLDSRVSKFAKDFSAFSDELRLAFAYIHTDASGSLTKSRIVMEKLLISIYRVEMGQEPRKPLLAEMLTDNQFTRKIERRIVSRMNAIRDLGNLRPHGERVESSDAAKVLDELCEVLDWHCRRYSGTDSALAEGQPPPRGPTKMPPILQVGPESGVSVSQLAQELNITVQSVMRSAREILGLELRTPGSVLRSPQADRIRACFGEAAGKSESPRQALCLDLGEGVMLELVHVSAGRFIMGSPKDEEGHNEDEMQHAVVLSKGFYLGRFPVTQAQYERISGENPSYFRGPSLPVETVSWYDAVAFCEELFRRTKRPFRLPTEAEWEYACRAQTTTAFHTGDTLLADQANFDGKFPYNGVRAEVCRRETTPVDMFPPDHWGLHDMHGNVWEWCSDWYGEYFHHSAIDPEGPATGAIKILRGGSWFHGPADCRSAQRDALDPGRRHSPYGFRVVLGIG